MLNKHKSTIQMLKKFENISWMISGQTKFSVPLPARIQMLIVLSHAKILDLVFNKRC